MRYWEITGSYRGDGYGERGGGHGYGAREDDRELKEAYERGFEDGRREAHMMRERMSDGYGERMHDGYGERDDFGDGYGERRGVKGTGRYSRYRR